LLTIHLAAKVTRGDLGKAADVVMLTAEDPLAQVVVPRLTAAGADLERVHFGSIERDGIETSILLPSDIAALEALVSETNAQLVVIDPLMAHLATKIDSWKDQKVREALAPLHRLAERTGVAILVVAHLNKGQGNDPLERLGGSIGIPAAARSVLLLGRDPDEPEGDRRVVAHVKSNLGMLAGSLAYELEEVRLATGAANVRLHEVGGSPYSGAELLALGQPAGGSKLVRAIDLLEARLSEGPVPVVELKEAAQEKDISWETVKRAKEALGVESHKCGFEGHWAWKLPAQQAHTDPADPPPAADDGPVPTAVVRTA
jgi:hypothetical protein